MQQILSLDKHLNVHEMTQLIALIYATRKKGIGKHSKFYANVKYNILL